MTYKTEQFEVSTSPLESEERVYLIGNCPQLGDWNYKEAIECTLQNVTLSEQLWTATVSLPCDEEIKYRYFIGTPETLTGGKVIKLWEICIQPRSTTLSSIPNGIGNHAPDRFGYISNSYEVDKGWLTSHSVLQLKLFDDPVKLWNNQYHETTYSFKLSAVDLHNRNKTTQNETHNSSAIKVTAISDELKVCKQQNEYGHVYKPGDFVIYEAQVLQNSNMAYRMDFYTHADSTPDHIGYSYILQDNIKSEAGNFTTVIISNDNIPQGQVTMEYVCVSPVAGNLCDMSVSYVKYWKETWTGLDVGHRGSGKVKALPLEERRYRENTVESLSNAGNKGADLVEFDVQLSKDDVPIIFHDFHFNVTVKKHDNDCDTNINVPLHEFTHSELNSVKVHDANDYCDESCKDNQMLFPTLESLLQTLDEKLGFNIELKIPVPHKNDTVDIKRSTVKLNKYVDIILKVIFENTDTRKIVFSSFHPDICTMVRLKQNKYPVLFLTQGITDRYEMLRDPRGHTTSQAILNAQAADLLGVCAHSQELLSNTELITRCTKTAGLILFCWGNELNEKNNITQLKELGVHGVIFDRIDEFVEKKSSAFREDVLPSHKSADKS